MKHLKSLFVTFLIALFVMAFVPIPARAQTGELSIDRILNAILVIVVGFAALAGVSKLTAAIVSLLKYTGVILDGTSAKWTAALNLVFFIALVVFRVFQPDVTLEILDGYAGQIAQIAIFVLGFVMQITGSKPTYDQLKAAGIPLISKSLSE
jgi:hypothetical protein